ncbi:VWA domain-containing protein [Treponema sp. TIM-1]|uniref:VWA domain-containing protein n=1 Tax=Treponema sp. TIM-1 TaxID=2898417 RepID=UPI00397F9F01
MCKKKQWTCLRALLAGALLVGVVCCAASAGAARSSGSATRGRYLAGRGIIVPPEEVYTDSYIASIDYRYPQPETDVGVYLYNSSGQMNRRGQEGILQIGIQGKRLPFEGLPPMNLAFVIDTSDSMNEEDKIAWVKESVGIFMNKIRDADSLALVSFNDTVRVLFESTRMDSPEKRRRFLDAVNALKPAGGTDLEAGLKAGYEQVLANYREGSVNRVLFFSDGTEFSSRLAGAGAQSGDIRVSLLWNNRNDLDIHVVSPRQEEIFYGHPQDATGGFLDVDMNVHGETTKPVENIFWAQGRAPQGRYRVFVQNFDYHEKQRGPTAFQVEIKNGSEYSHFEGMVSGAGKDSNTDVFTFEYKGASALKQEKALIYQLAESYRQMGVSISTLGVGVGFDLELMRTLAEEGGGSSRFISDREEMRKTFDTEFERMAVVLAREVSMELEFMPGVEILETWGYQHRVEGNRIFYRLPALHLGDYETLLVRYRLPAQGPGDERRLARFRLNAQDIRGRSLPPLEKDANIVLSDTPVDGISSGMVLYSGTMMRFAETLKEIGGRYYAGQDDLNALTQLEREIGGREPDAGARRRLEELQGALRGRLETALGQTKAFRGEMENAKLRLDDREAFTPEIEILARYEKILAKELVENGGTLADAGGTANGAGKGAAAPAVIPPELDVLRNRVAGLFTEISLSFPEGERSVAALAPFAIQDGGEPPLLAYLNESALTALAGNPRLTLVERSRLDAVRAEQRLAASGMLDADAAIGVGKLLGARYMITGQVIPMTSQVIVFGRVINVETGEILSAAQLFLDRRTVGELL